MKVFVLMYYNYDDTRFYGVFGTEEKAICKRNKLVEDSEYIVQYGESKGTTRYSLREHHFEIEEEEVQ